MEPSDENVQMLLVMGFPSESEVRRALKMAKNDMNEAVDILTNGQALTPYDDVQTGPTQQVPEDGVNMETDENQDFPAAHLYELESRVFTDSWSIPYREDESLAKCMYASIKLLLEGRASQDDLCVKFLDRCLPESFRKLLNSNAVHRWSTDIQEGVYDMIMILTEVVAAALCLPAKGEQIYIPGILLETLAMAFNADSDFHQKNKSMRTKVEYWDDKMGADKVICQPLKGSMGSKEYYWLSNLVNKFTFHLGFDRITNIIEQPKTDIAAMASLTEPIAACVEFLQPKVAKPLLEKSMKRILQVIDQLGPDNFKEKNIGKACDLLHNVKSLCLYLWKPHVQEADDKRLDLVLRMIKCPHFNAKMNALIEITRMIEDATARSMPRTAISLSTLTEWMAKNELLSIILSGSIDQSQYCEKVKKIVEHVGPHLSKEDLEKLWNRTTDQSNNVIDNIHGIFAAAASHFSLEQFATFSTLITINWMIETEAMKEKLFVLLGRIGKDTKNADLAQKVIELLWELSHRLDLSREHVDKCLDEMYGVMTDSYCIKDSYKRKYLERCLDNIKKGTWIMPALKQVLSLIRHIVKLAMSRADKTKIITDLHSKFEIIKLLVTSIISSHQLAVQSSINMGVELGPDILIDNRYTHKEYVELHLQCLQFMLHEANNMYMSWSRVKELWECMVENPNACPWDRDICYNWFTERISELDTEAICNLFTKELMTNHSSKLTHQGFKCWRKFFEQINIHEHKLKIPGLVVEKMELVGLEELWNLCLNVRDADIAQECITFLLQNLYGNLAPKFKREAANLHKSFLDLCIERLKSYRESCASASIPNDLLYSPIMCAQAIAGLEKLPTPLKPKYMMNIERLLLIVERYVLTVEEVYCTPRSILPHGASFYGSPLTIHCECETRKEAFDIQTHRNESLLAFRSAVAERLAVNADQVQFVQSDLKMSKDQRLLGQLGVEDGHRLSIRISYSSVQPSSSASFQNKNETGMSSGATATASATASATLGAASPAKLGNMELEKTLPGVMMSKGGDVFKLLYQLAELGEFRITQRIVALLHLVPTDPSVVEIVDNMGETGAGESQPNSAVTTPCASPTPSPRKVRASSGSQYGSQTSMVSRRSSTSRLSSLFNITGGPDTSPFRVRYNLEVLSSRIMPLDGHHGMHNQFCEEFMAGNGLSFILQVFQIDFFPSDVDGEVRQACYSIGLQIIMYLLCGETVRGSQAQTTLRALASMEYAEFTDMIVCMMRVAWSASVGKLQLSGSMQPIKDANIYGRMRQNSAGSTASSGSDTAEVTCLHAGVCLSHTSVGDIDASIAVKALEIMVYSLLVRPEFIGAFYSLPCVTDFVIDIVTGCCREDVRVNAAQCFERLSMITLTLVQQGNFDTPKHFLLKALLAARLPFWVSSASTRGARQRLLAQCLQYFDLRCRLLTGLSVVEQKYLTVDIQSMIEDEFAWLCNFQPTGKRVSDISTDDILLTAHLRLIGCLLTCEGVDKSKHISVVHTLLEDFLFPAAKLERSADTHDSLADFSPKCMVPMSQIAAYDVLLEMCKDFLPGLQSICNKLTDWHHSQVETTEWEYMPPVDGRASSGFVGLKNGGATCYMNSVLQQMFMLPGVTDILLNIEDDTDEKTVFHEVQQVLGHLTDSQLQFYEPTELWHVFKLWGQTVNVREQQDAFDFFTAITDQLDETLKRLHRDPLFQKRFQGVFSDQKNCEDCPHRYEREEPFLALNLTVSNPSLEDSLGQFVKGELLEGDNAYFCEKCNQKRNAVKRMCIKSLPPVLCIHLKRFSFDWEANKALKFDDYFKFPLILDMAPYTIDGKGARYELVGAVVHTGQASAGHYYSFIKDRRGSAQTNENHGKWYRFNDTTVEEFDMTEEAMESECFGGKYKVNAIDSSPNLPEDRVRYWNAYLLFYERIVDRRTSTNRRSSRVRLLRKSQTGNRHDSLSELTDLVHQGEQQGMFAGKMPGRVQRSVRIDNLQFMKNRNVYSAEYFRFMTDLMTVDQTQPEALEASIFCASKFVLNTYLHTKETLRPDMDKWLNWFYMAFSRSPKGAAWFLDFITEDTHSYIIPYLLASPIKLVREFFCTLLKGCVFAHVCYLTSNGNTLSALDSLITAMLSLLNREVREYAKGAHEYFSFFYEFCSINAGTTSPAHTCAHLMSHNVLVQFLTFLLGTIPESSNTEDLPRQFSSMQTREFGPLHSTIAMLLLHLDMRQADDVSVMLSEEQFPVLKQRPMPQLQITNAMSEVLSIDYAKFYIREALFALREAESPLDEVVDALVSVAHWRSDFSNHLIKQIRIQFTVAPGNELKGITRLAAQLMLLPDERQEKRLKQLIIDATDGALNLIKDSHLNDSQRSYQLIKLLVDSSENETIANFLLSYTTEWQWCVDWLKKKMADQSWMTQSSVSNEESLSKNFQRTMSAQSTLDKATRMMAGSHGSSSDMDVDSLASEEFQTVPNVPDQSSD